MIRAVPTFFYSNRSKRCNSILPMLIATHAVPLMSRLIRRSRASLSYLYVHFRGWFCVHDASRCAGFTDGPVGGLALRHGILVRLTSVCAHASILECHRVWVLHQHFLMKSLKLLSLIFQLKRTQHRTVYQCNDWSRGGQLLIIYSYCSSMAASVKGF